MNTVEILKNKGFSFKIVNGLYFFNFESNKLSDCINVYKEYNIENINLSFIGGFRENSLKSLTGLHIKRIKLELLDLEDYFEILNHPELVYLEFLSKINHDLDFLKFPNLEEFNADWKPQYKNVFHNQSIKYLLISDYRSPHKNFIEIANLKDLQALAVWSSNIEQLDGLYDLQKLRWMRLLANRKLTNNKFSQQSLNNLLALEISACKRFDLNNLPYMPLLKEFKFIENGVVPSLRPILERMPNLERLDFSETDVEEDDFTYLLSLEKIKKITFLDKRHYKFKEKYFLEMLAGKK